MIKKIIYEIKLRAFKKKWHKLNSHNLTSPQKITNLDLIDIGIGTYGTIDIDSWNNPEEKLIIGKYCSIASEVKFVLGGNHDFSALSTYPFAYLFERELETANTKGPIIIKDGVWIGTRVLIISGVSIGKGAVIRAGCVMCKDVPAFSVVVGNPMKVIKYRFSEEVRNRLKKINH